MNFKWVNLKEGFYENDSMVPIAPPNAWGCKIRSSDPKGPTTIR